MKAARLGPLVLTLSGLMTIFFVATIPMQIHLIWNGSASAPIGLYWISSGPTRTGDLVLVRLDRALETLFFSRGYLPPQVPLLKRIAASKGDEICRNGFDIVINGRHSAMAMASDSAGRFLPVWSGCHVLNDREIFLLNENPRSLDGRYFGVTDRALVVGRAQFLWAGFGASHATGR
jgi:conjugative transfer signal peptidase TraF